MENDKQQPKKRHPGLQPGEVARGIEQRKGKFPTRDAIEDSLVLDAIGRVQDAGYGTVTVTIHGGRVVHCDESQRTYIKPMDEVA